MGTRSKGPWRTKSGKVILCREKHPLRDGFTWPEGWHPFPRPPKVQTLRSGKRFRRRRREGHR